LANSRSLPLSEKTKRRIFQRIQSRSKRYLKPGDIVEARLRSTDGTIDLGVQRTVVRTE